MQESNNGQFIINGHNGPLSSPGKYRAAGTDFWYREETDTLGERIYALGPLQSSVDVLVSYLTIQKYLEIT